MGLQLAKTIHGHSSDYWKIRRMTLDVDNQRLQINLALYKDKATRDVANTGIDDVAQWYEVELNGTDFPLDITDQDVLNKNTHKLIYDKLKTLSALVLNGDESTPQDFTSAADQ